MSNDDTFFGGSGKKDSRTVLMPRPGGRSRQAPAIGQPPPGGPTPAVTGGGGALGKIRPSDSNPLAAAAAPLLSLAGRLANTPSHPDPAGLFRHVAQEVQAFDASVRGVGVAQETVISARYALCTLIDEVVLNTPWGSQSIWPQQTLLTLFHKEAWGGEKFFLLLQRVLQQPAANLDLLELLYLCLSMGLQGQYRVRADGVAQVEAIRSNVYQTLRTHRGEREHDLSPAWEGVVSNESPLSSALPFWAVGAIAGAFALAVFFVFSFMLNSASDPVALQIAGLGRNLPPPVERKGYVPPPTRELGLSDLLQGEIAGGALQVDQGNGTEKVTLRALFASGKDELNAQGAAAVQAVAGAVNRLPGRLLVAGHSDNVPARSLRFPSNWHLSKARAEKVRQALIDGGVDASRLTAEPRADSEPLASNDTPAGRATNRRVEIVLYAAPRDRR